MRTLACVLALCVASGAWGSFKCVDAKGASHFGDSPPAACANATTYEVSASGAVIRKIDPASAAQNPGPGSETGGKREDRSAAEAARRDRALLDSYTSAREIDLARDRNLEMIQGRIDSADSRIRQLEQRRLELLRAIASYGKTAVPPSLGAELESVRAEEASLAASRARLARDFGDTGRRFEADKARWIEMRGPR